MSTQADIPFDDGLTDTENALLCHYIDTRLNSAILLALLHGGPCGCAASYVGADQ